MDCIFDAFTPILLEVEEVKLSTTLRLRCSLLFSEMVNFELLNWDGTIFRASSDFLGDNELRGISR